MMLEKKETAEGSYVLGRVIDIFSFISITVSVTCRIATDLGRSVYIGQKCCACHEVFTGCQTISLSGSHYGNLIKVRWVCG